MSCKIDYFLAHLAQLFLSRERSEAGGEQEMMSCLKKRVKINVSIFLCMRRASGTNCRVKNTQGMPNKRAERRAFRFECISFQLCATLLAARGFREVRAIL
jgi:hypothetical protein